MNQVSLGQLYLLQGINANARLAAAGSSAQSGAFSAILAAQRDSAAAEGSAAYAPLSAYSALNAYAALNRANAAATDTDPADEADPADETDPAGEQDEMKNIILMLCLMMCANASDGDGGMNSMMMSLISALGGSSGLGEAFTEMSVSPAGYQPIMPDQETSAKGAAIVEAALSRLGDPYSKSKRGTGRYVDCSYLAKWAYAQAGVSLPSTSVSQAKYCHDHGYTISKSELQPGDLIFWSNTACHCGRWNEIHHVGIYAGNDKVIEAKSSTKCVVLDDIWGENGGKWRIFMYARPY